MDSPLRRRAAWITLVAMLWLSPPWGASHSLDWSGEYTKISQQLQSADPEERLKALHQLQRYPAKRIKEQILRALDDTASKVALHAAKMATQLRLREAVPVFLKWLSHWDKDLRVTAAAGLKEMGGDEVIHVLVRSLSDPESAVRLKVVDALSSIHSSNKQEVVPLMRCLGDSSSKVRAAAVQALEAKKDPRALIPLMGRLGDSSNEVRRAAIFAIAALRDPGAGSLLLRLIHDPNAKVASAAIEALGTLRIASAAHPLINLLERKGDGKDVELIAMALGRIGTPEAIRVLTAMLSHHTRAPHSRAALKMSISAALPRLQRLLLDPRTPSSVARQIIEIIQDTRKKSAVPTLIQALRLRRLLLLPLVTALGKLEDPRAQLPLLALLSVQNYRMKLALLRALEPIVDERAAGPLIGLLEDPHHQVKLRTIRLLGRLRSRSASSSLLRLATEQRGSLARASLRALAQIKAPNTAAALVDLLRSPDRGIRREASQALASIQNPAVIPKVLKICSESAPSVRVTCTQTLGGVLRGSTHKESLEHLISVMMQKDESLTLAAVDALGAMVDPLINPALIKRFNGADLPLQRKILVTLGNRARQCPQTLSFLLEAINAKDPSLRAAAIWALGKLRTASALDPLSRGASHPDPDVRINAAAGLAALRSRQAQRILRDLTEDTNPYVRANAILGLAWTGKPIKLEIFEEHLRGDRNPWVRMNALRALIFIAPPSVKFPAKRVLRSSAELIAAVNEDDPDPRVRAMAKDLLEKDPLHQETWISLFLLDSRKKPLRESRFRLITPSGLVKAGYSDAMGESWEEEISPGYCYVELPGR